MDHCVSVYIQDRSSSACLQLSDGFTPPVNGQCPPGFFRHRQHRTNQEACNGRRGRVCRPCTTCPPGIGAVRPCGPRTDTVCEACVPGTSYADLTSHEQPCLRCTQCSQFAVVERNCTIRHNAICRRCRKGLHSSLSPFQIQYRPEPQFVQAIVAKI